MMSITVPTDFSADSYSGAPAESNYAPTPVGSQTRACTNCVRAKAKCSIDKTGAKCERCERMKKECQPSPPIRARRTVKRTPTSRTSKLEQKLDGLVQLLESATQPATAAARATGVTIVNSTSPDDLQSNLDNASDILFANERAMHHSIPTPGYSIEPTPLNLQPMIQHSWEPSIPEAELYLDKFRTDFIKYLPCVIISPSVTAQQLRQERPMLWLCIMAVASNQSSQQIHFSRELRTRFGHEAFLEGRRSIDLLLAVLSYVMWDRRFCVEKLLMASLVQLAIAIVYDLELHKPPFKPFVGIPGNDKPSHVASRVRTMEERRAFLGCFLISSSVSYFLKADGLRWTSYSAECLRVIEDARDLESDIILVQVVKSALLAEKVMAAPWHGDIFDVEPVIRPPARLYLSALENQLQDLKSNIPAELRDNETLLLQLYSVEASIYEIGCSQEIDLFSAQSNRRLECLYGCLNAVKCCIDVFAKFTPAQYIGFPFAIYAAISRCCISFYRLLTFQHPEWDLALVGEILNFSVVLNIFEEKFSRVKDDAELVCCPNDTDPFTVMADRIRKIKEWWGMALGGDLGSSEGIPEFSMELVDEELFRDLFGLWSQ